MAHNAGEQPYFKVDGEFVELYFAQNDLVSILKLPETQAKDTTLVGKQVVYSLDTSRMSYTPDVCALPPLG